MYIRTSRTRASTQIQTSHNPLCIHVAGSSWAVCWEPGERCYLPATPCQPGPHKQSTCRMFLPSYGSPAFCRACASAFTKGEFRSATAKTDQSSQQLNPDSASGTWGFYFGLEKVWRTEKHDFFPYRLVTPKQNSAGKYDWKSNHFGVIKGEMSKLSSKGGDYSNILLISRGGDRRSHSLNYCF